jgi:uncharacterized protein YhaN
MSDPTMIPPTDRQTVAEAVAAIAAAEKTASDALAFAHAAEREAQLSPMAEELADARDAAARALRAEQAVEAARLRYTEAAGRNMAVAYGLPPLATRRAAQVVFDEGALAIRRRLTIDADAVRIVADRLEDEAQQAARSNRPARALALDCDAEALRRWLAAQGARS